MSGVQLHFVEPQLLGSMDDTAAIVTSRVVPNPVFTGNVPALFDRCMFDMVAKDPNKGIQHPGAFNYIPPTGTAIGVAGAVSVTTTGTDVSGTPVLSPPHITSTTPFVFTPLNSWKYWPDKVFMRFRQRLRRTFYNPTNLIQTVYVTELRRKRSQIYGTVSDTTGLLGSTGTDYELVDFQPYAELPRWGFVVQDLTGCIMYGPSAQTGVGLQIQNLSKVGAFYRRFLYPRFGQYEQIQLVSRGFYNTGNMDYPTGRNFTTMQGWDPRLDYDPNGTSAAPTDPHDPTLYGYSYPQNIRDASNDSLSVSGGNYNVQAGMDPWHQQAAAGTVTASSGTYGAGPRYEVQAHYNPLTNPYLRKLFYMRRTKYVISPGGSATHIFSCSGTAHPLKSRVFHAMNFYGMEGTDQQAEGTRQRPYTLPFGDAMKPAAFVHISRKHGWSDVSAIIQVKAQMMFTKLTDSINTEALQYGLPRVVCHDSMRITGRACSYGKPTHGGTHMNTDLLSSSIVNSAYLSMFPTAIPANAAPNISNT